MTKEADAKLPSGYRFDVTGMDCASCAGKIETAVARIAGASQVKVGLQSQTLSVNLDAPEKVNDVASAVKKLGYGITQQGDWKQFCQKTR